MPISTLAVRTGNNGLKLYANGLLQEMTGTATNTEFQPKITNVQHFYGVPAQKNKTDTCTGATLDSAGVKTRVQNNAYNECWVNFRTIPNSTAVGTTDTFFLRVFGAATHILISAQGQSVTYDLSDPTQTLTRVGPLSGGVFDLEIGSFLKRFLDLRKSEISLTLSLIPQRRGAAGEVQAAGLPYTYVIQLYSPLVINTSGQALQTRSARAGVLFDLQDHGQAEQVGWLAAHDRVGFLSVDLNGNGRIDSGAELFGQATRLPNAERAQNGFEALAQYDENRDGWIDAQDAIFTRLVVWSDRNTDGKSARGELRTLKDVGLTRVSVQMRDVAPAAMWNEGNLLRYEAALEGPACAAKPALCQTIDVYFDVTRQALAQSR